MPCVCAVMCTGMCRQSLMLTARRVLPIFEQHEVRPSCGRLVGFSAGRENLHGVLPLLKGRRCVIALWMTFSKDKDESNHDVAMATLKELELSIKRESSRASEL